LKKSIRRKKNRDANPLISKICPDFAVALAFAKKTGKDTVIIRNFARFLIINLKTQ
jgi:hypothetical protein